MTVWADSEPIQISKMGPFAKIINDSHRLMALRKNSILDVRLNSEYNVTLRFITYSKESPFTTMFEVA